MRKFPGLWAVALPVALLAACSGPILGGRQASLADFNAAALKQGQGAVLLHVVDQGGLLATRWLKTDDPKKRRSFTVYHSARHRSFDRLDDYDVVTVEPGTYALYSVFGHCDEGLRPASTDWDEPWRDETASALGQTAQLKSYKPSGGSTGGFGVWGGSGGHFGLGLSVGLDALAPGEPVAICNLLTKGLKNGRPMLASVVVKPGEVVYAGELEFAYAADGRCDNSGNWQTDNETRRYCGADWARLAVTDQYSAKARPFIERTLGSEALERAVVRLAQPGSFVSSR